MNNGTQRLVSLLIRTIETLLRSQDTENSWSLYNTHETELSSKSGGRNCWRAWRRRRRRWRLPRSWTLSWCATYGCYYSSCFSPPPFTLWNSKWWPRKWKVASQDERQRRFPILRVIRYATIATVPVGRWILLLLSYSSKICKLFQEVENIHVLMNFVSQCLKISKKISLIWIFFGFWYWFLEWKFRVVPYAE